MVDLSLSAVVLEDQAEGWAYEKLLLGNLDNLVECEFFAELLFNYLGVN